jgi:P27 family predicted phage terminase small subunit
MSDNVRRLRGIPTKGKGKSGKPALPAKPNPPSWLKGEGLAEWRRVTPELFRLGRLAALDRGCLAMYCSWWQHLVQIRAELQESGFTAIGQKKNVVVAPLWREYRDCTAMVTKLAKELGLTPDARLRQSSVPIEEDDDSDLDHLFTRPVR